MAKKRRKTSKRKNRSLSSGGRKSPRRRKQHKGFLSEIGLADNSKLSMMQAAKKTLGAGIGGGASIVANKLAPPTTGKIVKLGVSFLIAGGVAMMGMPSTGAGFFGGMVALNFQNGLLADDANFADENALADMPIFLDENDQPMVLEEGEDGTSGYRYLSDEEVQMLHEQGAFAEYEVVG